ncbi:MAG: PQQ-binding-like beta-propeller repeat protein [Verrucomicrobiales bacterium]|nr:PQQ-binding-like beta-propeller repeat protein [Verrucomicrobiales bacterium]
MKKQTVLITLLLLAVSLKPAHTETENWPQYRGANSDGLGEGATLPTTWSATENVVWKTKVPGWGWSSPIIWGDRVFLTSAVGKTELPTPQIGGYPGGHIGAEEEHRWMLYCLDFKTGDILWEFEAHKGIPPQMRHPRNSFASETPVTDGERVYAYFANIGLFCCDLNGKKLWERRWPSYPMRDGWNTGTSPVIHGDRIFIQNDNDQESFLETLDKRTGETLWRIPREEKSTWSTPYVWETGIRNELVTIGSNRIRSYAPKDGSLLWELQGTSGLVSLMPVAKDGLLYVGAGYHYGPLYAIRPGASGDLTLKPDETSNQFIAWSQRRGSSIHPCYLISGERLFVCYDSGLMACFHAKSGAEIIPKQRLNTRGGRFYASPWAYKGKVFMLNENGDTWVIEDGPQYKLIGKNSLGDVAWATPAIARGSLFIRTYAWLFRFQEGTRNSN